MEKGKPVSPKKKYQALKTKFIKLNEHLRQSDAKFSSQKKSSKSPKGNKQSPRATLPRQDEGRKSNMVINLEISQPDTSSAKGNETVKDMYSPVKLNSPNRIRQDDTVDLGQGISR